MAAHCSDGVLVHEEVNPLFSYHFLGCCCVHFQVLCLIPSVTFTHWAPHWAPKSVTYYYLGSIPVTNELHQASKGSKSYSISGGDSSSWVLVQALDPVWKKELQAISLGEEVEWGWGVMQDSSTFARLMVIWCSQVEHTVREEYKHSA